MLPFTDCNMKVFNERGITDRKNGQGEIDKTTDRTVERIKMMTANKRKKETDQDKTFSKRLMPKRLIVTFIEADGCQTPKEDNFYVTG